MSRVTESFSGTDDRFLPSTSSAMSQAPNGGVGARPDCSPGKLAGHSALGVFFTESPAALLRPLVLRDRDLSPSKPARPSRDQRERFPSRSKAQGVRRDQELFRAALRFARVPPKRKGCGAHLQTDQELLRAALRFARDPPKTAPSGHGSEGGAVSSRSIGPCGGPCWTTRATLERSVHD